MIPRFFSHLRFRTKINCGIVLIVALIALPLAYLTWRAAAASLSLETRKRGLVLSENLAARVSDAMSIDAAKDVLKKNNWFIFDREVADGSILTFVALTKDEVGFSCPKRSGAFSMRPPLV